MMPHLPRLDLLRDVDEKVRTETPSISGSDEMVEAYES